MTPLRNPVDLAFDRLPLPVWLRDEGAARWRRDWLWTVVVCLCWFEIIFALSMCGLQAAGFYRALRWSDS